MTRSARRLTLPLLLMVAALVVPALAPSGGGTQARWSDSEHVAVGSVTNDSLGLSMTGSADSSGLTLVNEAARLPGTVTLEGEATVGGQQVAGLDVRYDVDGSVVELSPQQPRDIGLTVTGTEQRSVLLGHAGQTVDVTTTGELTSEQARGWSSAAEVTTQHAIPFPQPTVPGNGGLQAVCETDWLNRGILTWAWPDSDGNVAESSPAVARWTIERYERGRWVELQSLRPDRRSSNRISRFSDLWSAPWFRVVGHSAHGTDSVPATFEVQLSSRLVGGVSCEAIR